MERKGYNRRAARGHVASMKIIVNEPEKEDDSDVLSYKVNIVEISTEKHEHGNQRGRAGARDEKKFGAEQQQSDDEQKDCITRSHRIHEYRQIRVAGPPPVLGL